MAVIPWLADVLRAAGVRVVEEGDWRNRSAPGSFSPIGVLWHHTAAFSSPSRPAPALSTCINGRSDLPGPLCHALVDYNGVFHLISGGRANHAGEARASGPIPAGDGNAMLIGWEIDYGGDQATDQAMTSAQYNASIAATGAVLRHLGRDANHARGHRETSITGKIDPSFIDLGIMRANVAAWMAGAAGARVGSSVVVHNDLTKVYHVGAQPGSPLYQRAYRPGEGWLPWLDLGGAVTGRPSVVEYEDHLHVFARSAAAPHTLRQRIYRPSGDWSEWVDHGGSGLSSDPVAVAEGGNLRVFAAANTATRSLMLRLHSPGQDWKWFDLGGSLDGQPAVTMYENELHVYARSANTQRSLAQRTHAVGRGWGPWNDLGGSLGSAPAVLVDQSGRIRVFAGSGDTPAALSQHVYDPGQGWRLTTLGGTVLGRPTTVSHDGYHHVFVRGADPAGALQQRILRPAGDWSAWVDHGGELLGDPVASVERGNLMAFAVGDSRSLRLRVHNPSTGTWQWIDLGGVLTP
ncbi:hypothetical protein Nm8I071_23330 [Nonomuraea sp. TT08I-71]|nr:hypothetical protein Nm8I071_23330 [Nonomuraea sp. TT08I-71]